MLSTENPPPDSSEIPQLKSGSSNFISSGEKASDNNSNNNQPQLEVDLFKSGLDDINQTLPKFTIRDYVFSTRGNNIKTHWPFSPKNLQLCLKHGVKDVLPPFETLESVRNPSSIVKYPDENLSNPAVKLSGLSDHLLLVSSKNASQKLASDAEKIKSNTSEKDKEYYPSTTTSLSCSDVNSVPFRIKSPFFEPEPENLPYLEKPGFAVRDNKVQSINITQNPANKCRLIVKLGNNIAEQKSNEELLETMASKVCPVCKTFTSSSNTTLNAHIDQCLSGESTIKWTANSKVMKHRIKPRKTRLMVDIYATALCCTLEDLDRRNGTNWASNLGFPAQDLDNSSNYNNNNNNNMYSSMNGEEKNEEGAVYFDSNGKKLRILSKFSDVKSIANGEDDCGPRKPVKRDQGSKIVTSKKKYLVQRHKVLKCPPYEQRSPRLDRCPEVNGAREMNFSPEENEKEDLAEPLKACDQMKSDDSGMIKQWVSSKRTGHKKKKNPEHESHRPNKITKNLRINSHLPSLDDKLIKRTCDLRFPMSSDDNPVSATDQSHKRKESMPLNSDDEYMPCRTNRAGFSLLDSRDYYDDKKNHMMLSKSNFKRIKGQEPSVPNGTGNHAVSRSNKNMRSIGSTGNVDSSFIRSRLSKHGIFSSGGKEFGSLKKTLVCKKLSSLSKKRLSVGHASCSESKKFLGRKRLDFTKSAVHMQNNPVERRGGNAAARMEKDSGNLSIDGARVLKIRKKRWEFVNNGKESDAPSKHSNASSESNSHGVEQNMDSFVSDSIPACTSNVIKVVEIHDEFVCEPISKIAGGEALVAFGESLAYEGHCSPDLVLSGEQEMLCAEKVDVNEGEGNYFADVDPIPIPGPPGSFLPSPGRMGSEELQGNSPLITCKIHSSEDDRVLIDHMDSSDSPVSGTSFISNSIAARSDSTLPFRSHAIQRESQRDVFENWMDLGADGPKLDESRAKLVIPETKFPICGDCESPSLSTSNPVLRLMGKNLMVANKEEINLSPQTKPTQSSAVNDFPNLLLPVDNVTSIGNIRNEHGPIFHNLSRGPSVLDNSQTGMRFQHFDFASSVGLSVRSYFKTPDLSPHLSKGMLSSRTSNEGLRSSLDCQEYARGYVFTHDQFGSTVKLDNPIRRENEASLGFKTTYAESMQVGSLGYDDSRHVNPFFGNQTLCYPFYSETQMGQHANTDAAPYNGMNGNSVIWNRTPEGRNAPTASIPSTGHPRSSLYFSSGFSLPTKFT